MLVELLVGVCVVLVCLYGFIQYLVWSQKNQLNNQQFAAPSYVADSYKVVKYKVIYAGAYVGIDLTDVMP